LVAVVANPLYHSRSYVDAFDTQERLTHLANWHYLTGSLAQLSAVWSSYGVKADYSPGGAMVAHSDVVYVIDGSGRARFVLGADPGPATSASQSSFAVRLTQEVETVDRHS
jgi:cytochrome oxidase Cu insertion factor (SCO1/SenC/PrrC family)